MKIIDITPIELKIPIKLKEARQKIGVLPPQSERVVRDELYRITCNLFKIRELTPEDFYHKIEYLTNLKYSSENVGEMLRIMQLQLEKTKEIQTNLKPW